MAVIKCKMCGGDLNIVENASTAECEYCGSVQTIPKVDDEKKLTLFARANRLRAGCEFDKAAGIYEAIVADFPEEAEAYWGLVLCKYGIEYVDDPATGKKIPTCHRSSFDSVMEDSDFEQALENADVVARKVYREEAKVIEEIRKGIIAVSANEAPYDIFICYKETDEKGERTLDSVLAQDIYEVLTDKGYRVFFARITLEDKLGMEYEPYIFAALNSAKIMLAFGTDYEYFNAVWVKNEWSRYLKLMAKDKEKHLIPCYKGIDAYDMPKEFAKLQAQDLGKVGATQDLMRGIEKILPRKVSPAVGGGFAQQQIMGGNPSTAPLLKRGYMALEDSAWKQAEKFFEEVLNQDPESAQAYMGKFLVENQCVTLQGVVNKRLAATEEAEKKEITASIILTQEEREAGEKHTEEILEKYALHNFLPREKILDWYQNPIQSYQSEYESRVSQKTEEEIFWINNKNLNRAMQFSLETKAQIEEAINKIMAAMDQRIFDAKAADEREKSNEKETYRKTVAAADAWVETEYEKAKAEQEKAYEAIYQKTMQDMRKAKTLEDIRQLKYAFANLFDYRDSAELTKKCRAKEIELMEKQERNRKLKDLTIERNKLQAELDDMPLLGQWERRQKLKSDLWRVEKELEKL